VSLLIDRGADINSKDNDGGNALIWAAMYNYESIFSLLIDRGADINSKDNNGRTALDIAEMYSNQNIISIIQKVNEYLFLLINNEYIWFIGYFCILILINNCVIILRM
jgi:ankyrin repeat protein